MLGELGIVFVVVIVSNDAIRWHLISLFLPKQLMRLVILIILFNLFILVCKSFLYILIILVIRACWVDTFTLMSDSNTQLLHALLDCFSLAALISFDVFVPSLILVKSIFYNK
jgi:hypothetical protein